MSVGSLWYGRRHPRRGALLIGIALSLILGLALGPAAAPGVAAGVATDTDALRAQALRDGWVRVRVDLRTDGAGAAPLSATPMAARTAAAASDTAAQTADDLLFALPQGSYRGLVRTAGASSLTLSVDAAGLDGLLASPLVATVGTAGGEEMRRIAGGGWSDRYDSYGYSLAINPDGSLWAWGINSSGELGDGTTTERWTPVQVLTEVAAVAAGGAHTLAIKTDGTLWAWGYNGEGRLGDGSTTNRWTPVQVMTGVAAVAAGRDFSLGLKTDGSLLAWGHNGSGQLGDGTTSNRSSPVRVLTGVAAVAAGVYHSLAVKTDGSLWAWGNNGSGRLGDGTTVNRSRPVRVLTGVGVVAGGTEHSLALKTDGSLWAWGANGFGQLGDGTTVNRSRPVQVLTGIAAVATGGWHNLALKTDGTLSAWGYNGSGRLGDGTDAHRSTPVQVLTGVAAVSAGDAHTLVVKTDSSLWAWGYNRRGRLGDGTQDERRTPTQVQWPGFPDFAVYEIAVTPPDTITNRTFSAEVTVINQGTGAGDGGSLEVWTDQADPQVCGTRGNAFATVGTLAPGESRTLTLSGLRSGAVGTKTLRAYVDGACAARETNDTDNQSTLTYSVGAAVADFVVTGVVLTPTKPFAGTSFRAAVTVRNQGRGAGAPRTLRLWPNLAAAPACGATGGSSVTLPTLAAGASTTVTLSGLAAGSAPGTRTLRAFVDPACLTGETSETNNLFSLSYAVNTSAPDFLITAATLTPTGPVANRTFDATLTVQNRGTVAGVPGSLRVWANRTDAPACGTAAEKSAALTASLAPGASTSVTVRGLPAGAAGPKTLRAFIEAECKATESDETNNQLSRAYRVFTQALPDFAVTALVPTPASPRTGATFSAAVTVRNLGAGAGDGGYLDLWAQDPGVRTCGASGHVYAEVGTLAAGESRTLTVTGLRAGAAGAATLRAFIDSTCDTAEADDANNQTARAYTVAR